jgi:hypothetical protein
MIISRICQECIEQTQGGCVGKDRVTISAGKKPCRKYELDPQLISDQDTEPDSKPPSLKDRKPDKAKPLIPGSVLPTNSKKAANFQRLAVKRLCVLLDGFRKLSNLGNKAVYEWTDEQVDVMLSRIRSAADDLEKKFI